MGTERNDGAGSADGELDLEAAVLLLDLEAQIYSATENYRELIQAHPDTQEALRQVALAGQRLWALEGQRLRVLGRHEDARRAMATASDEGKLAAKLAANSVVDRLAALEKMVSHSRSLGARLAELSGKV